MRLEQAYQEIARKLALPRWEDPKTDTLRLVCDWLGEAGNGRWLMVIDIADDIETFFTRPEPSGWNGGRNKPLMDYLPRSPKGSLMITTRDKRVAERLAGRDSMLVLESMNSVEAEQLLKSHIGRLDNYKSDDSKSLLEALENLPLAITQAAAFISENSTTPADYLGMLRENDSNLGDLLDEDVGYLRRDSASFNSVTRTWKLSFDLIRNQSPRATEMLSFMASLDRRGIPAHILKRDADRTIDVKTALGILIAFSLISAEKGGASYQLHRLVQLATQRWLEKDGSKAYWEEMALQVLAERFPYSEDIKDWPKCEYLLPHAQTVLQREYKSETCRLQSATLLHNVAMFDIGQGRYDISHTRLTAALKVREELLGPDDLNTLASQGRLAVVYLFQGRFNAAEKLCSLVSNKTIALLGLEHQQTLNILSNLALIHSEQGHLAEAEEFGAQVVEGSKKVHGLKHKETTTAMNNLAVTYSEQGRSSKALELQKEVWKISENSSGKFHPDTLENASNLALLYADQGDQEKAEKLLLQVVDSERAILGVEHPSTLSTMSNLAFIFGQQGRLNEAEELGTQVPKLSRRVLGSEHPGTLTTMANLAEIYRSLRRLKEAENLAVQVLEIQKRTLGIENLSIITSLSNLACIYRDQDRQHEAIKLLKEALELGTKVLGVDDPDTTNSA